MAQQITCTFSDIVKSAIDTESAKQNLPVKDFIVQTIEDYLSAKNYFDTETKEDIGRSRELLEEAVEKVLKIRERDGFSSDITFKTIEELSNDSEWIDKYTKLVKDNPFKHGNREKASINQNLGYYIKRALGAESETKNGRPASVKVSGSIIQSYTPLKM